MAWNNGVPSGTISPCASTVQITSNWDAIEDWWNVEHYTFSDAKSGMHKAGIAGIMLTGTNATIETLSSPGTGALTFDNTCGIVRIYRSTNTWERLTEDHFSRVKLTSSTQSLPPTAWTDVVFDTEVYDSLGEYNATTLRVKSEGYYLIRAQVSFPVGNYERGVGIYYAGTRYGQTGGFGNKAGTLECVDIVYSIANGLIDIYAYNGNSTAITMVSASVVLTRLS